MAINIDSYKTKQEILDRISFLEGRLAYNHTVVELKKKGDLHVQNIFRFFGRWVEKSDPLREAIKGIIFGILYGKSVKTLSRDLSTSEINRLKSRIRDVEKQILAMER